MNQYAHRTDANQSIIIEALQKAGYQVINLSRAADGVPDLLVVSKANAIILLEVKSTHGDLTQRELEFFENFRGPLHIVRTPEEAIEAMQRHDGVNYERNSTETYR